MFEIQLQNYPVDILTAHYRVFGELRVRGNPSDYLNDATVSALTIFDATLMPIQSGVRVGATASDSMFVPKTEPQIIILGRAAPEETSPLPKAARMICFTDTYVIRGTFHMGADAQPQDIFYDQRHDYFLASNLEIVTLYEMATEVKTSAQQAYINGRVVRAFFAPETERVPA